MENAKAGSGHDYRANTTRAGEYDAVIVGSGPNGLAAAITLAQAGWKVCLFEGRSEVGGGLRSAALTLPGHIHDVCSAFHPLGVASPFFRRIGLEKHGLTWRHPEHPLAHPLPGGEVAVLHRSIDDTCAGLGRDGARYRRLIEPMVDSADDLLADLLAPFGRPRRPALLARFGLRAAWPATWMARGYFREERARALFAGNAAHSFIPLSRIPSGAVGIMLAVCGHAYGWPVAQGGSVSIARCMEAEFRSLGGEVVTGNWVRSLDELPPARFVLCDLAPRAVARIAGDWLPEGFRRRLTRYRHGPAAFKLDWALDGPVPWINDECGRAGTVHLGGLAQEIVAAERLAFSGEMPQRPFVLVGQQSIPDPSRAPAGRSSVWAYAHVPHGHAESAVDAIEAQVERFAPGFRDRILKRSVMTPQDLESYNPNYVGGDIVGGVADLPQLFHRPVGIRHPYATPNPRLFLCSASTPPGAGVHGMCGWHAAKSVLRRSVS